MLINLFGGLYGPDVIAAFSGAMLFTLVQRSFQGGSRVLIFLVSFLMGITGADTTFSLIKSYVPDDIHLGKEAGAFVCSTLIVTVSMLIMTRVEKKLSGGGDK